MKLKVWREIAVWLLAFLIAVAMMSWNPLPFRQLGQTADFLFALQLFAAYFYRDLRSLSVCLTAGFLRDLIYGTVLGPDMLVGILISFLGERGFSEKLNRNRWGIFPQALWLYPLSRVFRTILFSFLPARGEASDRAQILRTSLADTLRSFPGMLLALAFIMLLLILILPPVKDGAKEEDTLELSEEKGKLW